MQGKTIKKTGINTKMLTSGGRNWKEGLAKWRDSL